MSYYSKSILGDLLTPVSAFLRIAAGEERAFLLESVEGAERIGRYSFIGFAPQKTFRGSYREFRRSFSEFVPPDMKLPPLCGGAVGFFTYDLVREFERIPTRRLCDDGPRIELPVSVPRPTAPRLAATAAAVPPLLPAVTRPSAYGLRV